MNNGVYYLNSNEFEIIQNIAVIAYSIERGNINNIVGLFKRTKKQLDKENNHNSIRKQYLDNLKEIYFKNI